VAQFNTNLHEKNNIFISVNNVEAEAAAAADDDDASSEVF
jgi:hypothetical protein